MELPVCYLLRHKVYDEKLFLSEYFRFIQVGSEHVLEYPIRKATRLLEEY